MLVRIGYERSLHFYDDFPDAGFQFTTKMWNPKKMEGESRERVHNAHSKTYTKAHPGEGSSIKVSSNKNASAQTSHADDIKRDSDRVFYHIEIDENGFVSENHMTVNS